MLLTRCHFARSPAPCSSVPSTRADGVMTARQRRRPYDERLIRCGRNYRWKWPFSAIACKTAVPAPQRGRPVRALRTGKRPSGVLHRESTVPDRRVTAGRDSITVRGAEASTGSGERLRDRRWCWPPPVSAVVTSCRRSAARGSINAERRMPWRNWRQHTYEYGMYTETMWNVTGG